jgi:DNA-binding transcriptional regulator YiaG
MKESTYRVLEFTREDLERLVKEALSSEFQKMMGMINNLEGNRTKSDLMTREEVSKLLNVSLVTLHNWEKRKVLVSRKVGGRVLYLRDEVYSRLN